MSRLQAKNFYKRGLDVVEHPKSSPQPRKTHRMIGMIGPKWTWSHKTKKQSKNMHSSSDSNLALRHIAISSPHKLFKINK